MTLHMKAMEDHAVRSRKVPDTIRPASYGLDTSGEEASGDGPTGDRNPIRERGWRVDENLLAAEAVQELPWIHRSQQWQYLKGVFFGSGVLISGPVMIIYLTFYFIFHKMVVIKPVERENMLKCDRI